MATLNKRRKSIVIDEGKPNERKVEYLQYTLPDGTEPGEVVKLYPSLAKANGFDDVPFWKHVNSQAETTKRNRVRMVETQDQTDLAKAKRISKSDQADPFNAELAELVAKYAK